MKIMRSLYKNLCFFGRMLEIFIITPFPDFFNIFIRVCIKKSVERDSVKYNIINLFDFLPKRERLDDYP